VDEEQPTLPFDVAVEARRTPARAAGDTRSVRHRLQARAGGWPAGTELLLDPRRRLRRGDLAVVREGQRSVFGVYHVRFGRPFLLADREVIWIGPGVEVVGVVTVIAPPLS
jgi:hypothetical protein